MKKSVLFLSLLMIFALVLFTGCDGLLGGGEGDPTAVTSFEVEDDSAVEMTYTASSDDAMLRAMVVMGQAQQGDQASQYQAQFTMMKQFMNYAKITEAQIVALADLIEANESLGDIFGSDTPPTAAQITQILDFYKAAIGIIGNDAAGKLAYHMALQQAEGDAEAIAAIEAAGYDTFVVSSRMMFAVVNSIIWSIDSSDVTLIASLVESEEDPTNAEIVQLIGIASDSLEAISLEDTVWTQFFTLISTKIDELAPLLPEDFAPSEGMTSEDAIAAAQDMLAFLGTYMTTNLRFLSEALDQIDVAFLDVASASAWEDGYWDDATSTYVTEYYINDVEVTEDEYKKHEFEVMAQVFGIVVEAYNALPSASKTKMQEQVEDALEVANTTIEEQADEAYTYTGTTSTFADVIAELEDLAAVNFDSLTYEQVETEFTGSLPILLQYLGAQAPYVYLMASESMNSAE